MEKGLNILSLFDGVSCGRVALDRVGIKVDKYYSSEIDKYAIAISRKNFPDIVQLGDINNWRGWNIDFGEIDLLTFGSPCQSYSVAGKRKGLEDKRGGLIYRVFELLKKSKPKLFLFENVPGLLSHEKGKTFAYILKEFNKCGYALDWIVINSNLVSAQNRKRIYVVGKRLDTCQGLEYIIDI